jgi:hypothetical protein
VAVGEAEVSEASTRPNVEYGDRDAAVGNEILRSTVGSGVHGIAIEGTDDHDEMGVYIAPPDTILGLTPAREDYTSRTQPEGVRSGPGDTDLIIYSLRKYLSLALKGNPTALLPLYAPGSALIVVTPLGEELRAMRSAFLSQQAVERFLGYLDAQHERMMGGGKRNRVPNRPELIEAYGWDVKYGSHALRLAYQGWEIVSNATLTLPLAEDHRQHVLSVKRGEVPQKEVSAAVTIIAHRVRAALDSGTTPLPKFADRDRISEWAIDAQRRHWGWV